MIKSVLVLSILFSTSAFAQRDGIGAEAQRLAAEVQRNARNLNRDQVIRIQDKFQDIRSIIYGSGAPQPNYTCVARDNDGARPFVYALRDGLNMTRIGSMTFQSMQTCQDSINSIKYAAGSVVACVSRDGDDAKPWVFATITGATSINKIARTATASLAECKSLMDRMLIDGVNGTVTYCTARDNDGARPFVAVNLNLASGQIQQGTELFQEINACWSFLGN